MDIVGGSLKKPLVSKDTMHVIYQLMDQLRCVFGSSSSFSHGGISPSYTTQNKFNFGVGVKGPQLFS